ncbi:hypothetical protein BHU72_12175 [Desulfuribacillus stibiiarsenatis]|uniref:DUF3021 domain-containing protein n=1 Tax=Desulfuribacillus stibiiarsenatis TaxID=1390249 RepID=A0A1E5L202_9FIRM|nr:hypothetical protein [Desulfuribacillus stibiiarsenatis]OEH84157.1 hypothetical protein BHU72_12175 [Desulfuribacillus stibiiarsenatis]
MFELKKRIIETCISFTSVLLIYSLLGEIGITLKVQNYTVFQLFGISAVIAMVMFFTDQIPFKTVYTWIAVSIADIFVVVFVLGGLIFQMFPFTPFILLVVSMMIIVVYFVVFGVMVIKNQVDAHSINKKLLAMRGEGNE